MSDVEEPRDPAARQAAAMVRRNGARLHPKNLVTSVPEKIDIEEIRADPAYQEEIEKYLREVDRQLVPYMKRAVEMVPDVSCLRDGVAGQIRTGGKRLRAGLCVLSCEMFNADFMRALDYAAAIEHIQNFTLIHDDIADGDIERRSEPSIWQRYGIPHAINIGDIFIPLSSRSILQSVYPERIKLALMENVARFGVEMASGQAIDINLRNAENISVADYITCTKLKTGSFLAMAVVGGGIIGGAAAPDLERLHQYSVLAGVAFQIKDDSLDFSGSKGREIGSDIREGKITAHAVHALNNVSSEERRRLRRILRKDRRATRDDEIAWVLDLYRKTGAIEFAQRTSTNMIEAAVQNLLALPDTRARERLIALSRYISRRTR